MQAYAGSNPALSTTFFHIRSNALASASASSEVGVPVSPIVEEFGGFLRFTTNSHRFRDTWTIHGLWWERRRSDGDLVLESTPVNVAVKILDRWMSASRPFWVIRAVALFVREPLFVQTSVYGS